MDSPLPPLSTLTEADIIRLVTETKAPESRSLEYKTTTNFKDAEKQKKFLKTVSAFANGHGGDLIFGIAAEDGIPTKVEPLQNFNADETELQVAALVRAHLQPRLFGVQYKAIPISSQGHVFVVRVPKTWSGPHMLMQGENRFYIRDGNGNRPMDFTDVSLSFTETTNASEKLNALRFERCAAVLGKQTPVKLPPGPTVLVHLVPFESLSRKGRFDVKALLDKAELLLPLASTGYDTGFDMNGAYNMCRANSEFISYSYCLRSGVIETATSILSHTKKQDGLTKRWLHLFHAEIEIVKAARKYFQFLKALEIFPPVACCISFLNIKDYMPNCPHNDSFIWYENIKKIQQDHIHLDPVVFDSFEAEVEKLLLPAFNGIWHECGQLQSPNYDSNGNWNPRLR